jgi:hypothetical protein
MGIGLVDFLKKQIWRFEPGITFSVGVLKVLRRVISCGVTGGAFAEG